MNKQREIIVTITYNDLGIIVDTKAEERKKGKWINHRCDDGLHVGDCNLCGEAMMWFEDDIKPNYCSNCGARMEGNGE